MDIEELIQERYSCRKFTSQPVEAEKLEKIIAAGLAAPTAVNMQPVQVWQMESQQAKDAVRACTQCHFGADVFLVVGGKAEKGWIRKFDNRSFADVDASIVASHMMLEIQNLGLGTTWVGYFDAPKLKTLCPQMDGWDLIAIFPIGYPAEGPSPRHTVRKSPEDILTKI